MNGTRIGLSCCFLAALTALGCTRPVVPEHVRGRVAYGDVNPAGTWVQVAEDGSTSTIELTVPEGRHQLFGVRWSGQGGGLNGEAFVDGDTVYATRHSGSAANDLCLYLYERRGGVVEAIWGSARGVAPVAYEQAHLAASREGDWNGVYAEWGNNMGGVYQDRLIIGRALQGDPRIHRLHWTQTNNGWYRGTAFEFGERLVGVRLPGVLVRQSSSIVGNYVLTQRSTEVGRGVHWVLGAYRLEGDALVGVEATAGDPTLKDVRWTRASAGGVPGPVAAPQATPALAPTIEPAPVELAPVPAEPTPSEPESVEAAPAAPADSAFDPVEPALAP
jgi:hypothetical protein